MSTPSPPDVFPAAIRMDLTVGITPTPAWYRTQRMKMKKWRAQEDLNPRTRIRSPLLYPG
jgi:hypothetical protein